MSAHNLEITNMIKCVLDLPVLNNFIDFGIALIRHFRTWRRR